MKKFLCRYPATASLFILLFCIVGLLINGCSKKDQAEKQIAEIKPAPASTFFTVPPSTDPFVLAIANSLQRQDVKGDIELQLSQHAGLAKWDNAIVAAGTIAIIAEKNAEWKFIYNEDEDTIEPFLRLPDGSEISVFIDLSEEAMEDFQTFSVYATAQLRLDRL